MATIKNSKLWRHYKYENKATKQIKAFFIKKIIRKRKCYEFNF